MVQLLLVGVALGTAALNLWPLVPICVLGSLGYTIRDAVVLMRGDRGGSAVVRILGGLVFAAAIAVGGLVIWLSFAFKMKGGI